MKFLIYSGSAYLEEYIYGDQLLLCVCEDISRKNDGAQNNTRWVSMRKSYGVSD